MQNKFKFKLGPVLITSLVPSVMEILYSVMIENGFHYWTPITLIIAPLIALLHIVCVGMPFIYILSFRVNINLFWLIFVGIITALLPSLLLFCFFQDWNTIFSFKIIFPIIWGMVGGYVYWKAHIFFNKLC